MKGAMRRQQRCLPLVAWRGKGQPQIDWGASSHERVHGEHTYKQNPRAVHAWSLNPACVSMPHGRMAPSHHTAHTPKL